MPDPQRFLAHQFEDNASFINTFDELPLWSASFGLFLLEHLKLQQNITVVDAGCGAGFPLLELAERLGKSCKLFGVDVWKNALDRAKEKIKNYGIENATLIECSAAEMPFENDSIDLIVSNLGINNFEEPAKVFLECYRVLKPGGRLALTTNLNGHWQKFYDIFEATLLSLNEAELARTLQPHQEHRGSIETISQLFGAAGFQVTRHFTKQPDMHFLDGSAFLNHHFIKLGWLDSWRSLIPESKQIQVFGALEQKLNEAAETEGELCLSVPMLFMEGVKEPC